MPNQWISKWLKIYLKCYFNLILYYRNVYPSISFDLTTYQGFNLPQFIPVNRHPQVQEYLEELINDVLSKLNHIYQLNICIVDKQEELCVEKFVLDFSEFKHVETRSDDNNENRNFPNTSVLSETEIFDEFRSSLNSLIKKLEKLTPINNDSVTFEIIINTVELELGQAKEVGWNINTQQQLTDFDRDINWAKCQEDENLPTVVNTLAEETHSQDDEPTVRMISLIGCDIGPLIIHTFMELTQFKSTNIDLQKNVYNIKPNDIDDPFGSLSISLAQQGNESSSF